MQPYIPSYRIEFFVRLRDALGQRGIRMRVLTSQATGAQAARGDDTSVAFQQLVREHAVTVGGKSIRYKRVLMETKKSALTVVELATGALDSALLCSVRPGRTAVWGHGAAWVSKPSVVDTAVEHWMMRRARHTFVYTSDGVADALRAGVPEERITAVGNTVDVDSLATSVDSMSTDRALELLGLENDVGAGVNCAFIGGLDESKRIDFLLDAGRSIAATEPRFRLIVAGSGRLEDEVRRAASEAPWLHYIGRADTTTKAALAQVSQMLLNPGRVGLIAVDSFAMGTPIATTKWPFHAPEVSYLQDGITCVLSDDDVESFSQEVIALLHDEARLVKMSAECRDKRAEYSLDGMVSRFRDGIMMALGAD